MDRLGVNQGGVVDGVMNRSVVDRAGMMDWSVVDGVVDRPGVVDGSVANTEVSLLPESIFSARLVGRDLLLHHLHLQLQVISCGHQGQRHRQQRYEELLAIL